MNYSLPPADNTLSNTCPLLVSYEATQNIVPSGCSSLVASVYAATPPVTSFAKTCINVASSSGGAAHLFTKLSFILFSNSNGTTTRYYLQERKRK